MKIQFLGATETVTGSKYFLSSGKTNILVDCGLFQGYKELRLKNWMRFPIPAKDIHYILLTHAHIDHSGYVPLLVKNGFRGKIICTAATKDLCKILLPDSGYLQEEEARYANKKGYSKHTPALPLYTREEAEASLAYFHAVDLEKKHSLSEDFSATFYYGGHILGASFIKIEDPYTSILFSGDLGRQTDPVMYPPKNPPSANYLVVESTYGNRLHSTVNPQDELAVIINNTAKSGGVVLIPSFAVGRAQQLLFYLHELKRMGKIPNIPVFVDSPMATDATKLFYKYYREHRLSAEQALAVCKTAAYMHTVEDSKSLNSMNVPMIIISASGMATGGRVLHHINNFGQNHRNSIVFCGYQAGGTRGDLMVRHAETIKIFGRAISIHAKIFQVDNMSAHADYSEMLAWLSNIEQKPTKVFITHGEKAAAEALKQKIEEELKWPCVVPEYGHTETLV
ncbi:MAG: MBL fold metallo-hydrolase [Coxiellaceae bacterium]|nr:MBL fold metallo-hydrolase [Coxiellaceae bacterium]